LAEDTLALEARRWWPWLAVWGPGLMVMLADTDAGSLVTAAQSGAAWGYRMLLPQLVLVPVLYLVQEVTLRLGLVTGQGHGALIRARFGRGWAYLSAGTLFVSAVGALVTEFSGISGVGALVGLPDTVSVGAATVFLVFVGLTGQYRRVERVGLFFGLFELAFLVLAGLARPSAADLARVAAIPWHDAHYRFLLAANVGAVVMPWMIFYQQGAVVDKGLARRGGRRTLREARWDTAVGALVTQSVMMAMVLLLARARPGGGPASLTSVAAIGHALAGFFHSSTVLVLFGLGMLGASLVAALVVSIAGAWGLAEVLGVPHSLDDSVRTAPVFYGVYTLAYGAGALLVLASRNLVALTVDVEAMNAMLLPVVLGFLLALEARALPAAWRMQGVYKGVVWTVSAVVMGFGLYTLAAAL
jgi:Mn2+/Fe2+ NRAMP family transporter